MDRNDVYLCQTELDVGCMLQLWTLFVASKTVYADRTLVKVPPDATGSGCWTPYGWYVFCDLLGNVYRVQPGAPEPEMVVTTAIHPVSVKLGSDDNVLTALVCPSKQGFMLYTVNQNCQLTVIMIDIIISIRIILCSMVLGMMMTIYVYVLNYFINLLHNIIMIIVTQRRNNYVSVLCSIDN